jgi:spermidine/putrescine-binding protein
MGNISLESQGENIIMTRHSIRIAIALAFLSCFVFIIGCRKKPPESDKHEIHESAQDQQKDTGETQEQVLRLLIWEGYAPRKYVEKFEKYIEAKYGRKVKLQISAISGPEDFYGPIRNKKVDLVTLTHHYLRDERFNYVDNKLIIPIDTEKIPNFSNVTPDLRKADYLLKDGQTYAVPICQGPYGLAYNTSEFDDVPETWRILWAPKYKGKYVLGGKEYLFNICTAALAWGYPIDKINSYDTLNNNDFREKLRQLATGAQSFWVGQDSADDLSGNSLAAVWGDSLETLRKRGQVWKLATPKEKTLGWVDNYAITWALEDKPFLLKVAHEWINRLLEVDYQVDYIVREISLGPITTNISEKLTSTEKDRLHMQDPDFFSDNRILLPTSSRRDRNGLKILWSEAMKGIRLEKGNDQ